MISSRRTKNQRAHESAPVFKPDGSRWQAQWLLKAMEGWTVRENWTISPSICY